MRFLKCFMVLSFILALTGCTPSPVLEGTVISSKTAGGGITEHLVKTNRPRVPYYILKANNNKFHQGSKVVLDLSGDSMAQRSY